MLISSISSTTMLGYECSPCEPDGFIFLSGALFVSYWASLGASEIPPSKGSPFTPRSSSSTGFSSLIGLSAFTTNGVMLLFRGETYVGDRFGDCYIVGDLFS